MGRMSLRLLFVLIALLYGPAAMPANPANPGKPDAVLASGGRYYGPLKNGRLDGQGLLVWPNGDRYRGGFRAGLMSGYGRLDTIAGEHYKGAMEKGRPNGRGVMLFGDGSRYEGIFVNGYPQGKGRVTRPGGSVYEGDFLRGRPDGRGRLTRPDGSVYKGTFVDGSIAQGEWKNPDGGYYKGGFKHWRFSGKGVYKDTRGNVFEGIFADGQLVHGRWHDASGNRYQGAFKHFRLDGVGTYTAADGSVYSGTFHQDELTGVGRYNGADGDHYSGGFKDWRYSGIGRLERANGDVYTGQFKDGDYDGWGVLTLAASKGHKPVVESGRWIYGERKGHTGRDRAIRVAAQALYSQPRLLDGELKALEPPTPGAINLYLVTVAGDGTEEVFRREAEYVSKEFGERFGTRGHTVVLANSRTSADRLPMATTASLRRALTAVAKRMDPKRDILFLFITSHGSRTHWLSLREDGIALANLKAAELGRMLRGLHLRYKVVVISACYSGGFTKPLDDGHTLIITAARADRSSFGCADENRFTYFGRAFFKDGIPQTDSFVDAFAKASDLVRGWEDKEKMKYHSEPQIHREPSVEVQLGRWRRQLAKAGGTMASVSATR